MKQLFCGFWKDKQIIEAYGPSPTNSEKMFSQARGGHVHSLFALVWFLAFEL